MKTKTVDTDREFRRLRKFMFWLIDGRGQHGITPKMFKSLTPERVEEIYNVDFGN